MNSDKSEKGRVTISIPDEESDLLEEIDEIVSEGIYESRTDVFRTAVEELVGAKPAPIDESALYDAAHSAYLEAHQRELECIRQNARDHILKRYGQTKMLDKIDEIMDY